MRDKEIIALLKMIEYIDRTQEYIKDFDFDSFCKDNKTVDATVFAVSQIGELVKNLSQEFMNNCNWGQVSIAKKKIAVGD